MSDLEKNLLGQADMVVLFLIVLLNLPEVCIREYSEGCIRRAEPLVQSRAYSMSISSL